jgi:hypothetical protein
MQGTLLEVRLLVTIRMLGSVYLPARCSWISNRLGTAPKTQLSLRACNAHHFYCHSVAAVDCQLGLEILPEVTPAQMWETKQISVMGGMTWHTVRVFMLRHGQNGARGGAVQPLRRKRGAAWRCAHQWTVVLLAPR